MESNAERLTFFLVMLRGCSSDFLKKKYSKNSETLIRDDFRRTLGGSKAVRECLFPIGLDK